MIYVFLAEGFEECEALVPIDILRRASLDVKTVGVGSKTVTGSHGIPVVCDIDEANAVFDSLEAVILPGGMPGTVNLEKSETVQKFIDFAAENKSNMWDSIKNEPVPEEPTPEHDDDMDVPPSLRERFKNRKKK